MNLERGNGAPQQPREPGALVLAPYGRDAGLLARTLKDSGVRPLVCRDVDDLLAKIESGPADILVISDDALRRGSGDCVLAALGARPPDDILPLVLLTGSTDPTHPLTRFPGVLVIAKPTRRRILDSAVRTAVDTRRRVLELRARRRELEERNDSLEAVTEELKSRNLELANAMRAKDRFVATMSHELRTPLNAILGFADLLDAEISGPVNDVQKSQIERIGASGRHLRELIDDILDLARANAEQLDVKLDPLDIEAVAREAVALMTPQTEFKRIQLTLEPPAEPLPPVLGDHRRVHQILLNLLSNAVKFTERGTVTVGFDREGGEEVLVSVRDTGAGIAPEEMSFLFTEFYQADSGLTRKHGGTGLGLAISHRLAHLMGGDLSVESELGEGATFTLTLSVAEEGKKKQEESVEGIQNAML